MSNYEFKIHVENETLILRGSTEESLGCVLRGYVILHLKECTRFKSISMNLIGRMKIQWNERVGPHQRSHKRENVVLEHQWIFLPAGKKLHNLEPDTYRYPFELVLPGDLPESIDGNAFGSLSYKLKAIAERPAFSPNLSDRKSLRLIRCEPAYHINHPMRIASEWADRLDYEIIVPKKVFNRGQQIVIDATVRPRVPGLHVRYFSCFLKEYTSFTYDNTRVHTDSRIIRFFRDESFPSRGPEWHKRETLQIPYSFNSIQCDTTSQLFRIEHKLKFIMSLINAEGHLSELRASMPLVIALDDTDESNALPTYEDSWRSARYEPYLALPSLDTPNTLLSSPASDNQSFPRTPGTPSRASSGEPQSNHHSSDGDYFSINHHQNCPSQETTTVTLGRVPSYRTALRSRPEPVIPNNTLPSYDILCQSY
ncbi:uncharacterized protein BYT42DRAFT_536696 [Radiomyces spectabilis]|uniref:uncharacterized protein n=1 Tax=Radiomyces spectabilis TaxID=64574 RepID=UPI0022200A18|nr:uncharacterized protein BYT42DRAFT_536696 [Radiomyces spectabilis]KAI8373072.1 hypothetical protein BYT42DRAFT_536696 [Radiomyces spectabilis]